MYLLLFFSSQIFTMLLIHSKHKLWQSNNENCYQAIRVIILKCPNYFLLFLPRLTSIGLEIKIYLRFFAH